MSARDQMIASIATVIGVFAFAWGVYGLLRRCRRLASLMDDGDGQGGVPPLPRRTRPADPPGLVHPALEQWLATARCRWCSPGEQWIQNTDRCTCRGFCGADHCLYDLQERLYGGER